MKLLLVLAVAFAALSLAHGERFHFGATLTGAQAVPPVQSSGEGSGSFHYDDDDHVLHYDIVWEGIKNIKGAHIHGPARPGSTAGHVIEFKTDDDTDSLSGSVEVNKDIVQWLHNGLLYVNVHTEDHEEGELRGQIITTSHEFFASLRGEHQRPTPVNTDARGHATFKYDPDLRELRWEIDHDVDKPTMAHIHGPASDAETAGPLIVFDSPHSTIKGSKTLTDQQIGYLKTGLLYVNIHSEQHPDGAIRGQIRAEATSSGEQGTWFVLSVGLIMGAVAIGTLMLLAGVVGYQHYQRQKYSAILPEE
eukprot:TRINITY_DN1283_c0_g1_i1.p2 TRINITY_DN1283_c0_g1~~TRINITY_DN1283_c0_g1_i1.p2  ORF type:complete len:323 (-),score=86.95 TRINITY_DN1283_c0_g1_i1:309-1226(-)